MIIGISGKIGSGKDTVGNIIQLLTRQVKGDFWDSSHWNDDLIKILNMMPNKDWDHMFDWENKKFADELKNTICRWIGCTRSQLEDRDFKEGELGPEWTKYFVDGCGVCQDAYFDSYEEALDYRDSYVPRFTRTNLPKKIIMTPRLMLQLLGTNCGRDIIHPNIWVNSLMSDYKPLPMVIPNFRQPDDIDDMPIEFPKWLITDTRFPNEAESILSRDGLLIRVNRGDGNTGNHPSETSLDSYTKWSYVIDNNGTMKELIEKVREILIKEKLI